MTRAHPALTEEHEAWRDTVRRFVEREIMPHAAAWDEAGEFPRGLYRKAAAAGLLGLGFPEEYGGTPADYFFRIVSAEEFARAGTGGLSASLFSHTIGSPPIAAEGSEFVVNGEKTFITSGMRADYYTVAVRTGGPGAAGVSLLLIERDRPGFTRAPLRKMGWWCSDTASLHFDEVRVPAGLSASR